MNLVKLTKSSQEQFQLDCKLLLCFLCYLKDWSEKNPEQFNLALLGLPFTPYAKLSFRQLMNFMRVFCMYKKWESTKMEMQRQLEAEEKEAEVLQERAAALADFAKQFNKQV